jgi:phosphonate transport system substrate-binding protein
MKSFITYTLLFITLVMAGCKNKGALDENGVPKKLVIAVFESENPDQMGKIYGPVCKYLEKKMGMPVEMILTTDYTGVIEALKSKKVHMAYIGPFAYIIATRSVPLIPITILGINGKPGMYHSIIMAGGHSPLKSMADVKSNAKSLTLCFVDPASTSGHLIPRAYLNSIGLNPDTAFKQALFAGSHIASVLTVKSGKVDIGCSTDITLNKLIKRKMLDEGDIKILWTSAPIVNSPIVVRTDLSKQFVKKLQAAYLNMNRDAPQILNTYTKLVMEDTLKRSYVLVQDSMYNGLRKIAAGIKGLKAN